MSRRAIIISLIFIFMVTGMVIAQESTGSERKPSPAGIDLHGKAYMGFMDLSDKPISPVNPAATDDAFLPIYLVFGHYDNTLYGAVVVPSEEEGSAPPAKATNIILEEYGIIDGEINGTNMSFTFDEIEELGLTGELEGTIEDGGNKFKCYAKVPIFGKIHLVDMYRCNVNDYLSGQYVGTASAVASPTAALNNFMIGTRIAGNKASFTAYIYNPLDPEERYTLTGDAAFNQNDGSFFFDGNAAKEEPDVTGKIANGVAAMTLDYVDGTKGQGNLRFFDDKKKKNPKLKAPKPKKLGKGKVTKVKIKHKFALMGSLLSIEAPTAGPSGLGSSPLGITRYEYNATYYYVWVDVPANAAKGKYYLTLTGPNGKTAKAKKPLIIK